MVTPKATSMPTFNSSAYLISHDKTATLCACRFYSPHNTSTILSILYHSISFHDCYPLLTALVYFGRVTTSLFSTRYVIILYRLVHCLVLSHTSFLHPVLSCPILPCPILIFTTPSYSLLSYPTLFNPSLSLMSHTGCSIYI
jgi:hypothetical protein